MTENRTLAEFAGEDADGDTQPLAEPTDPPAEDDADAPAEGDDATTSPTGGTDVDAATVTYAWSPEGGACDACGEPVDRRWRAGVGAEDPDSLVCDGCKEW